jgi:putative tryptophan/tyrosine transport system substrate-binding protein
MLDPTRRQFITLLGGAAAWPISARAQQRERMRRVGVLMNLAVGDPEGEARSAAFLQALQQLGWSDGRNVRIDYRWAAGDTGRFHRYAEELLALAPDVILASATPSVQALQQATRTVPIVFAIVSDPVGAGFVDSLARPGGNLTGFTPMEFGFGAKWLELIKEIAPRGDASDGTSGSYHRACPVGRYPIRGAVARHRVASCQRARCRRDRAFHLRRGRMEP